MEKRMKMNRRLFDTGHFYGQGKAPFPLCCPSVLFHDKYSLTSSLLRVFITLIYFVGTIASLIFSVLYRYLRAIISTGAGISGISLRAQPQKVVPAESKRFYFPG